MPCMCGDYLCPSCGPAMGYDPTFELICEWLGEVVFPELPEAVNAEWFIEAVANGLGRNTNQDVVDVLTEAAKVWANGNR